MKKKTQDSGKNPSKKNIVKKTITDFLKILEIEGGFDFQFAQNESEGKEDEVDVVLNTKDSGVVIGYHGEVLESLQLVLSLIISKKLGHFTRVSIDVGDYKKNRTEFLKNLAFQTKEKVLEEKREFSLSDLKSWERRVVHLTLQDDEDVVTESVGEGKDRALIIKPR